METHRHSHTQGKRWTHYLWEFLMLFFAVFAGFIAENLRENFTERKREKKYIESLVDDLKKDTLLIRRISKVNLKLARGQDSLIDLLNNLTDTTNNSRKLYLDYFLYTTGLQKVEFAERTMTQLLNAGNMRLIEKHGISDSIMDYYLYTKSVMDQGNAYEEYLKKTLDLSISIFDFTYARATLSDDYKMIPKARPADLKLLTADRAAFKNYAVHLSLLKAILQGYLINLKEAELRAAALIELLKKTYHLREATEPNHNKD